MEIHLDKDREVKVGALGQFSFPAGFYYYCGSAQRGLEARIERHARREKRCHWHIDYLTCAAKVNAAWAWNQPREGECYLSGKLLEQEGTGLAVKGFGASDCNCSGHLIYSSRRIAVSNVMDKGEYLGCWQFSAGV
ncbi:MAG: GIY-YIG nuclease family protein [Halanaerobium sp.]|nr:GIY-YIG nuclease family protein [Halanaerobium sp.]